VTQVYGTTLPATIGSGGGAVPVGGSSFPSVEQILFVDKGDVTGAEDGSQQNPFHSVEDALAAAVILVPAADNQIAIYIYPGIYTENNDIELEDYIHLVGMCREACIIRRTVGVFGKATLTVKGPHCSVWNLTFLGKTASTCIIWDTGGGAAAEAHECSFLGATFPNEYCSIIGASDVLFVDCIIDNPDIAEISLRINTTGEVVLKGCEVLGLTYRDKGDFYAYRTSFISSHGFGVVYLLSTDSVYMADCKLEHTEAANALVFAGVATPVTLLGNRFVLNTGSFDVHASADTVATVQGNSMSKGMHRNVISDSLERWSTGQPGDLDYYASLLEALKSVEQDGVVVNMLDDEVFTDSVVPVAFETVLDLRGHRLSRAARALLLDVSAAGTVFTVQNGEIEGQVEVEASADLSLKRVRLDARLTCNVSHTGSLLIDRCRCEPGDGNNPLRLDSDDSDILVRRSFLKGEPGTNNGAILWRSDCGVEAKYSTFSNGDGVNEPFERSAAQTPTVSMYQCGINAVIPAWITNAIAAGQEQNSIDADTDFP